MQHGRLRGRADTAAAETAMAEDQHPGTVRRSQEPFGHGAVFEHPRLDLESLMPCGRSRRTLVEHLPRAAACAQASAPLP